MLTSSASLCWCMIILNVMPATCFKKNWDRRNKTTSSRGSVVHKQRMGRGSTLCETHDCSRHSETENIKKWRSCFCFVWFWNFSFLDAASFRGLYWPSSHWINDRLSHLVLCIGCFVTHSVKCPLCWNMLATAHSFTFSWLLRCCL